MTKNEKQTDKKITLLCWHAKNYGTRVLENTVKLLKGKQNITVERVLYLTQTSYDQVKLPDIEGVTIEDWQLILEHPTQHKEIYALLETEIIPAVRKIEKLHINISPGTPAMHAVWLLMHARGLFPQGTQLWSSQKNPEGREWIDKVDFFSDSYLAQVRAWQERHPEKAVYNLQCHSAKRREALQQLGVLAKIPHASLLLLGERGTGKRRVAESLAAPVKGKKDLVCLTCGASEEHRFIEEIRRNDDQSIIFFDEVQHLPFSIQRRLIREWSDEKSYIFSSSATLHDLRERLDSVFFDRLTHYVVTIPPLRECHEDLKEDWERVWNECYRAEDERFAAPLWSKSIELTLKGDRLNGNFNDMQCLVGFIKAFYLENRPEPSIQNAIDAWKKRQEQYSFTAGEIDLGKGRYQERVEWFRQKLTLWALNTYGGWSEAAKALEVTEKTLRNNFNEKAKEG